MGTAMVLFFCFGVFGLTAGYVCFRRAYLPFFLTGIASFAISQLLLRIPILQYLNDTLWYLQWSLSNPMGAGIFAAATAGMFEETFRWLGFVWLKRRKCAERFFQWGFFAAERKELSWTAGVAAGLGHGGVEAVWIGTMVLPYLGGTKMTEMNRFLCGFERMCCLAVHTAFAMLVMRAVQTGKKRYLAAAVLIHGAADLPAALGMNVYFAEGYVFLCFCVSLWFLWKMKKKENEILEQSYEKRC